MTLIRKKNTHYRKMGNSFEARAKKRKPIRFKGLRDEPPKCLSSCLP